MAELGHSRPAILRSLGLLLNRAGRSRQRLRLAPFEIGFQSLGQLFAALGLAGILLAGLLNHWGLAVAIAPKGQLLKIFLFPAVGTLDRLGPDPSSGPLFSLCGLGKARHPAFRLESALAP